MANQIEARISLTGGAQVKKEFEAIGKAGADAFKQLEQAQQASVGFGRALSEAVSAAPGAVEDFREAASNLKFDFQTLEVQAISLFAKFQALRVVGKLLGVALLSVGSSGARAALDIQKAADAAGVSLEQYQRLQSAARATGTDVEPIVAAITKIGQISTETAGKLDGDLLVKLRSLGLAAPGVASNFTEAGLQVKLFGKELTGGAAALALMGVNLVDLQKKAGDPVAQFNEFARALARIPDEATRARVATEVFGAELGQKLLSDLKNTTGGFGAFAAAYRKATASITEADQRVARAQQASLGRLTGVLASYTQQVKLAFVPLATEGQNALLNFLARNRAAIEDFTNGAIKTAIPIIRDFINATIGDPALVRNSWVLDAIAAVKLFGETVYSVVSGVIVTQFKILREIAGTIAGAINSIFGTNFTAEGVLAAGILLRVTGAFTVLGTAVSLFLSSTRLLGAGFRLITALAAPLFPLILRIGTAIAGLIPAGIGAAIAGLFASLSSGASGFLAFVPALIGWPALLIAGAVAAGIAIGVFWDDIVAGGEAAWEAIKAGASAAWEAIKNITAAGLAAVRDSAAWRALGDGWEIVKAAAAGAWESIKATAAAAWQVLVAGALGAKAALAAGWELLPRVAEIAWNGIKAGAQAAWEFVSGLIGRILSAAGSAISALGSVIVPGAQAATAPAASTTGGPGGAAAPDAAAREAAQTLVTPFEQAKARIAEIIASIAPLAQQTLQAVVAEVAQFSQALLAPFETAAAGIQAVFAAADGFVQSAFASLAAAVDAAAAAVEAAIERVISSLQAAVEQAQALAEAAQAAAAAAASAGSSGGSGGAEGKAAGGLILGPGTGTSDSIPAWLSTGEFVIRAAAVRRYGVGLFRMLNGMTFSLPRLSGGRLGFADGGLVGAAASAVSGSGGGGLHPLTLVMPGGQRIGGLKASPSAAQQLLKAASRKSAASAGPAPGWEAG